VSDPTPEEAQEAIRDSLEARRIDLVDAVDLVGTALHRIENIDLPTAKMIGRAFLSTLQDAQRHTLERLDQLDNPEGRP